METRANRRLDGALLLALWAPYLVFVHRFWFVADDAYISFRYSRNWARGLGLGFNPTDVPPAEGYSNFLMVVLGAGFELLGLDMQFWLPLACTLAGSALLALVFLVLRRRLEVAPLPAFLATAALAWSTPFAVWSSTGLEAMPYALLFFAAFERLVLRRDTAAGWTAGSLAVLLAMTRVEGIGWAALVFPALAVVSRRLAGEPVLGALARYFAVLAVGYGAYWLWRYDHFGLPWPTTVYAKVGFTLERALRGVDYLVVQFLTVLSLFAVVPGTVAALRPERRAIGLAVAAIPLGTLLYVVLVGGDWMTYARFLVPAMPFVALGFAWFLGDLARRAGAMTAGAVGLAAVVLATLSGFDVHPVPETVRARFHFRRNTPDFRSEFAQWEFMRWNGIRWTAKGHALAALRNDSPTLVMGAIGAASYVSDWTCLDRHGFVTPAVALREVEPGLELRSPGHDKVVEEGWFVENGYDPDYLRAKLHEARRPDALLPALKASMGKLRRSGHDDRYVVEFHGLDRGSGWYLVLWSRIPEGQSSARAWAELDERISRFRSTGECPILSVQPPGDRVPGVPDWF